MAEKKKRGFLSKLGFKSKDEKRKQDDAATGRTTDEADEGRIAAEEKAKAEAQASRSGGPRES